MSRNRNLDRRTFVAAATSTALVAATSARGDGSPAMRVAVIGHTGRGNYGHGLDTAWLRLDEAEIVGVADADAKGLELARKKLKVDRAYRDYRRMLREVKPEIVSVCPRHPDQHLEMVLAAVDSGARGVWVEKPFCRTPAEADAINDACRKDGVKLAVAHRNRYHPVLPAIDRLLEAGEIGKLLEIRGRGKGDRRGGAEDLWVLGSHVMNLFHYFGGEPRRCSAVLRRDRRLVTSKDVYPGNEALGPLAGNELHARFEMERDVVAYFDSIANDGTKNAGFGLQLIGSEGIVHISCDRSPLAHLIPGNPFRPTQKARPWIPISTAGPGRSEPDPEAIQDVVRQVTAARDLVAAIRENREPVCDGRQGATTVEMICAVFASHVDSGRAVSFPLASRGRPFAQWSDPAGGGDD